MSDFNEIPDVKVYTMNKVFNLSNIKQRVEGYVNRVYCDSSDNRKIRKAFRNQLLDTIREENSFIKNNLRVIERKRSIKKRRRRQYKPTPYVLFCREMKQKHGSGALAGKIQSLWRDRNNTTQTVVKEECIPKSEEKKEQEYNDYLSEMKKHNPQFDFTEDSDSD
jgi:hypothetical protein